MPTAKQSAQPWNNILKHFFAWWVVLTLLVIAAIGYFLLRGPWQEWLSLSRVQSLAAELSVVRKEYTTLEADINAWQTLISQRPGQLDIMMPTSPDVPNLLAQLEAVTRAAGFKLDAIAIAEDSASAARGEQVGDGVRKLNLSLGVSGGSYTKLKALLAGIQKSWRILQVNAFSISGNEGAYRLKLDSYYYPR